jgi:hypothetical protein
MPYAKKKSGCTRNKSTKTDQNQPMTILNYKENDGNVLGEWNASTPSLNQTDPITSLTDPAYVRYEILKAFKIKDETA